MDNLDLNSKLNINLRPKRSSDEINLIEFPLSTFGKSLTSSDTVSNKETKVSLYDKTRGKPISGVIRLSFLKELGTDSLLAGDEDLILTLSEMSFEVSLDSPEIEFPSISSIINRVGWSHNQESYVRLLNSLRRLRGMTIETDVFYDKKFGYSNVIFGILSNVTIKRKRIEESDISTPHKTPVRIIWDPTIWNSFQQGNYKYVYMDEYRKVKSPGARKLYRILDKKLYLRTNIKIPLTYLCVTTLGYKDKMAPSYYKFKIAKYLQELKAVNLIKSWEYTSEFGKESITFYSYYDVETQKKRRKQIEE